MKILYLTGGGSVHDRRFLRKFAGSEHTFYYVYLHQRGEEFQEPGIESFCLGFDEGNPTGVLARGWATLRCAWRFRRLLKKLRPDIIHHGPVNSASIIAALSGFHPQLLMPWGSDMLVFPDTKGPLYRLLARFIIRCAEMITCDAELVKNKILNLSSYSPERIVIFPWGIDLHQFHPSDERRAETRARLGLRDSKLIVMNRSLLPVYGIQYFLQALPFVFEKLPSAKVFLIGGGPLKASLQETVAQLNLQDRVSFLGSLSNDLMAGYLNAADLYVSASLSDGTSTSLLEAMACGLPIVVSDAPANYEWIKDGENGFVVERGNVIKIGDRILEVLQNDQLARRMGERSLQVARERADWDRNYDVLEQIYHRLGQESRRGEPVPSRQRQPAMLVPSPTTTKNRLRVAYLTSGGSVHEQRFLKKFAESNLDASYIYLHDRGRRFAQPGLPSYCLGFDERDPKGFLSRVQATIRCWRRLRRLLAGLKPDLLHAGPLNSGGLIAALSMFRPLLLMPWGSDTLVFPDSKGGPYRMMARFVIGRSDMIVSDAEEVKRRILDFATYPADRIAVFPWSADLRLFRPSSELRLRTRSHLGLENFKVIVMTRSLSKIYGVEYFLHALPAVFRQVTDARAILLGDGPSRASLMALVKELDLQDRVEFLGEVANEQVPDYLNASDLYVSTSLSDGTSNSLIEAMACGLPVIVSDAPSNLSWIRDGENGFVVERGNIARISQRIIEVLQNESLSRLMGERNLRIAQERADFDRGYATLEGIYQKLTVQHGPEGVGALSKSRIA